MNTTLQHLRSALSARLVVLLAALAMWATTAAVVVTPTSVVMAQESGAKAELNRLQSRHDESAARLDGLKAQRQQLEGQYRAITAQVSRAKRAGADRTLIQGMQLENLLEQGRVLADSLNELQQAIRATEGQLNQTRRQIVATYDSLIGQAERDLLNLPAGSRAQALTRINALNKARQSYVSRREATPDLNLKDLSRIAEAPISDPDEAEAAAAELDDANRKLKKRITALDTEIEQLRERQNTRAKARDFQDQELFFDEQVVSGRQVARANGPARSQASTDRDRGDVGGGGVALDAQGAEAAADDSPTMTAGSPNEGTDADNFAGGAENAPPGDGATGASGGVNGSGDAADPNVGRDSGSPVTAGSPESVPNVRVPNDPFGSTGVVVRSDVQPSELQGPSSPSDNENLNSRLKRLEREKEKLERKSQQFQERSEKLKKLADEL
ncbi:MAG: hypothetical protein CMH57_01670 [Myxococcales bacterium]|nr:hypothetical protein [Myxococcales bacterium]